jgi:hypothetical protein
MPISAEEMRDDILERYQVVAGGRLVDQKEGEPVIAEVTPVDPALVTMAAYIDLNPVRARIVQDPKDYRWCGYREAVTGHPGALKGIKRVVEVLLRSEGVGADETLRSYRKHLFVEGDEVGESIGEDSRTVRGALSHHAVLKRSVTWIGGGSRCPLSTMMAASWRAAVLAPLFTRCPRLSRPFVTHRIHAPATRRRQPHARTPLPALRQGRSGRVIRPSVLRARSGVPRFGRRVFLGRRSGRSEVFSPQARS